MICDKVGKEMNKRCDICSAIGSTLHIIASFDYNNEKPYVLCDGCYIIQHHMSSGWNYDEALVMLLGIATRARENTP